MKYYIWSDEHGQFWKANHAGYTRTLAEAGVYSSTEARHIIANANAHTNVPNEYMIPAEDEIPADKVAEAFMDHLEKKSPLDKLWEEYNIENIGKGDTGYSWEQFKDAMASKLQTMIEEGIGK